MACTPNLVAELEPAWQDFSSNQVISDGVAELVVRVSVRLLSVNDRGTIVLPGIDMVRQALVIDGHCYYLVVFQDIKL